MDKKLLFIGLVLGFVLVNLFMPLFEFSPESKSSVSDVQEDSETLDTDGGISFNLIGVIVILICLFLLAVIFTYSHITGDL